MDIIRNADIARLVLGYLQDQNLEKVANIFCRTSPYLHDEYILQKKGFRLLSLGSGQLMDIIKEYCEIKSKVAQFSETLPQGIRNAIIKHNTLSKRISLILEVANKGVGREEHDNETSRLKRRRSLDSIDFCNLEATRIQDLPGYSPVLSKRRRLSGSYLLLNSNKGSYQNLATDLDVTQQTPTDLSSESDAVISSREHSKSPPSLSDSNIEVARVPSIPAISESLLENSQFQNKLVENINRELQNSTKKQTPVKATGLLPGNTKDDALNRELDEMIKNIMVVTEKDPTFEEIIEDVVYTTAHNNSRNLLTNNRSTQVSPRTEQENTNQEKPDECEANKSNSNENPESLETEQNVGEKLQSTNSANIEISSTLPPNLCTASNPSQLTAPSVQAEVATISSPQMSTGNIANNLLNISLLDSSLSIPKFIVFKPNETLEGQLSGENIISSSNLSNIQDFSNFGDQVVIDMETGHMSIPISMANTSFDLSAIINNNNLQEMQQCNFTLHTPVVEEVFIPADQLPISTETVVSSEKANNSAQTNQTKSEPIKANTLPTSLDSRVALDKATPSTSKINPQIFRSLSTPRRRTSHVRVLNFSSPLKSSLQDFNAKNGKSVDTKPTKISEDNILQTGGHEATNFIRSEESLNVKPTASIMAAVATESSNSNSLDFAVDKSNQTVIRKISETPKRKTNSKTCVRNLSRSNSIEDHLQKKSKTVSTKSEKKKSNTNKPVKQSQKKSNLKKIMERKEEEDETPEENLDPMQLWQKMRADVSIKNFDQHLRKIVSKTLIPAPRHPNKKRRRRIGIKVDAQESLCEEPVETKVKLEKKAEQNPISNITETLENKGKKLKPSTPSKLKSVVSKKKTPVKRLFNIQISTPRTNKKEKILKTMEKESKGKKPEKKCGKKRNNETSSKDNLMKSEKDQNIIIPEQGVSKVLDRQTERNDRISDGGEKELLIKVRSEAGQSSTNETKTKQSEVVHAEIQRRTANIAILLETPYKDLDDPSSCPFTPRFLIPEPNETPITKMMNSIREASAAKNFDVPTPSFAITPGSTLTPKEKETPKSGHRSSYATDYSSGGSYYRPDESEDLDKDLDRILTAERQNRKMTENAQKVQDITTNVLPQTECTKKPLEIKVVSVPAVLERVKSFSDETPNVMPHYTFVEGLPSHESASLDSSNSSASSSSSGSSSNSNTTNSSGVSLSNIESSEDEEWKQQSKESITEQLNDTFLITEDGEVRYPVRSWITPKKSDTGSTSKIQPESGVSCSVKPRETKTVDECQTKRLGDLEEKRLRMKEKLKKDQFQNDNNKQTVKILKKEKIIVKRKIITRPRKMTTSRQHVSFKKISPSSRENSKDVPYKADNQVDMLKALNLSKRTSIKSSIKETQKSIVTRFVESNDNAVMNDDFPYQEEENLTDREEGETVKITNAALALTAMQKKKTKFTQAIPIKGINKPKRGRPLKQKNQDAKNKLRTPEPSSMLLRARNQKTKNVPESTICSAKSSPKGKKSQKPFTEQISPQLIKQPKILLKSLSVTPTPTKKEARRSKQQTGKVNMQPIQISEIRSSVEEATKTLSSELPQSKEKKPVVNSNTEEKGQQQEQISEHEADEEEEDEDPYDLCKLDSINENDREQYRMFVYDGPDNYVPSNPTHNLCDNILSSVMNIFLDGKPHVLRVTDEIELFKNASGPEKEKLIKNVPKKRNRKEHIEPSSKKYTKASSTKGISETPDNRDLDSEESRDGDEPSHTSTPLQPNFRIIYQSRGPKSISRSGARDCTKSNNSERSAAMPIIDDNWVSSSTSAQTPITNHPELHNHSIKAEDINAVLSHLHGDDEI